MRVRVLRKKTLCAPAGLPVACTGSINIKKAFADADFGPIEGDEVGRRGCAHYKLYTYAASIIKVRRSDERFYNYAVKPRMCGLWLRVCARVPRK